MIKVNNNVFHLSTKDTSYIFTISHTGHLLGIYYGKKINPLLDYTCLCDRFPFPIGGSVVYDENKDSSFSLDNYSLEYPFIGKGDYRESAIRLLTKEGYVSDFKYVGHEIKDSITPLTGLPTPHDADKELSIYLKDEVTNTQIELRYIIFFESNVILRTSIIANNDTEEINIEKFMSFNLDMNNHDYELINLYGGWIVENTKAIQTIKPGTYINDSKTGGSSARRNPFFMIKEKEATYNTGNVYAFNLIYSGNHYACVELSTYNRLRIQNGINPYCFNKVLKQNESFEAPFAVLTFSHNGINGASNNMHHFVNHHVINKNFAFKERPLLINNWEATYFKFNEAKLLAFAKEAKEVGLELFVLDDGWFGERNNDFKGLGDYNVNKKKLPHGLDGLAKRINKIGLKFGLWFEPESVNEDSDLYRTHPDWAIKTKNRTPSKGRHQLLLDLSKDEVVNYIIDNVSAVLESANIEYVKWDMNRHISDMCFNDYHPGEFYHRYILGLYKVMDTLTKKFPKVLFEGCSSGGNRFDLGILSYFPQIWTSDDTDGYQRNIIQSGTALGYPLSTISAHVSASPSHQLLRQTPIDTRFNVASFGVLGYELDLKELTPVEKKAIKKQIKYYKTHRKLFQFGNFYQFSTIDDDGYARWMVQSDNKEEAIIGHFNSLQKANPGQDYLYGVNFIDDALYEIRGRKQEHNIKLFGSLINMILPVRVNHNGLLIDQVSKRKTMPGEEEIYTVYGDALNNKAVILNPQWMGTGFNEHIRVLGDFGSRIYHIKKKKN